MRQNWFAVFLPVLFLTMLMIPDLTEAEPTLQQVFDQYFGAGVINVKSDEIDQETFLAGWYEVRLISRNTISNTPIGWYSKTDDKKLFEIVPKRTLPVAIFDIEITEEFGLWIYAWDEPTLALRSEAILNPKNTDFFLVFKITDGYAIGIEDCMYQHNEDFQDYVILLIAKDIYGDVNGDGTINVADPIYLLDYLFASGSPPVTDESAEVNCDERVNIADAVYLIYYLFAQGPAPGCQ